MTDQGTEYVTGDDTIYVFERYRNYVPVDGVDRFLFPCALMFPGHLHILYNALTEALLSLDSCKGYLDNLRVVEGFFAKKYLRRAFQLYCVLDPTVSSMFDSYSTVHIDWRWEFLGKALNKLVPLLQPLYSTFDLKKFPTSHSKADDVSVAAVAAVLAEDRAFVVRSELFRVIGTTVEEYAKRLEGCHCRKDIWFQKKPFTARSKQFRARTGFKTCMWKGRMGHWFVSIGLQSLLDSLATCTSPLLDQLLADLDEQTRAGVIRELHLVRARLIEIIRAKFAFYLVVPYKALGIYYCMVGGIVEKSKTTLRSCIAEVDAALAAELPLHRVALLLFGPGTLCRIELEQWLTSDLPLTAFSTAHQLLLELALSPLVERAIEAVHAAIKRLGQASPNIFPTYLCPRLREEFNLERLRTDILFNEYVVRSWKSQMLRHQCLSLRYSATELRGLSRTELIKRIYQSTVLLEHENTSTVAVLHRAWQRISAPAPADQLPDAWSNVSQYLKSLFTEGDYYSMPGTLFDDARARSFDFADLPDPVVVCLNLAGLAPSAAVVPLVGEESDVFFMVTNSSPEKRKYVRSAHRSPTPWSLHVVKCFVVVRRSVDVVIYLEEKEHFELDVRTLVWRLQAAMTSVCHWDIADTRSGVIESATSCSLVADHASHFVPLDISACEDPLTSTLAVVPTSAADVSSTVSFFDIPDAEVNSGNARSVGRCSSFKTGIAANSYGTFGSIWSGQCQGV